MRKPNMKQANAQLYLNTTGRIKQSSKRNLSYWRVPGESVKTKSGFEVKKTSDKKALWKVVGGRVTYAGHK